MDNSDSLFNSKPEVAQAVKVSPNQLMQGKDEVVEVVHIPSRDKRLADIQKEVQQILEVNLIPPTTQYKTAVKKRLDLNPKRIKSETPYFSQVTYKNAEVSRERLLISKD